MPKLLSPRELTFAALCVLEYVEAVGRRLVKTERDAFRWILFMLDDMDHNLSNEEWGAIREAISPYPIAPRKRLRKVLEGATLMKPSRNGKGDERMAGIAYTTAPAALTADDVQERLALLRKITSGAERIASELASGQAHRALGYTRWEDFEGLELRPAAPGVGRKKPRKPEYSGMWLFPPEGE